MTFESENSSFWFSLHGKHLVSTKRSNCQHPLGHQKRKRVPEKYLFLFYWLCQSLWCVDHNKLWKILKEMGIPYHLTCLMRNLYAGQEATVRTGYGTTDWFQIGKGVRQGYCYSALKGKDILTYVTSMNLDSVMLSEINTQNKYRLILLIWATQKC